MSQQPMDRKLARRIAGRLRVWADFRRSPQYPAASISGAYKLELADRNRLPTSRQERWLLKHEREVRLAGAVERAFRRMAHRQRLVIFRRYILNETWQEIADALKVSPQTAFRDQRAAFRIFAEEFGLIPERKPLNTAANGR